MQVEKSSFKLALYQNYTTLLIGVPQAADLGMNAKHDFSQLIYEQLITFEPDLRVILSLLILY